MNIIKTLLVSALLMVPAATASAASLVYESNGSALVELPLGAGSLGDFFDDGADDLDISVTGGFTAGLLGLDIVVSDASGVLLESSSVLDAVLDIIAPSASGAPTTDTATIIFGLLGGSDTGLFGDTATVVFSFFAEDELDGFIDPVNAKVFSDLAVVPLPATLPLLGFALAGIATTARRRKA